MFEKKNAQTLLRLFSALSDEEKEKFLAGVNGTDEETAEEAQDAAEDEESTSDGKDTASEESEAQTTESDEQSGEETALAPEEPAAEEESDEKAPEPAAEDETDAAEEAAPAEEVKKTEERDEALLARITALEELVAKLAEAVGDGKETDDGKTFGTSPSAPDGNDDALAEDDRIMRRYYAKQGYRH